MRWFTASWFPALFAVGLFDQVALPSVAAGVESTGRVFDDPYGRALRTAAADQIVYLGADPERREEVARLMRLHRDVRGTSPDGVRFSALHPESWNWILISTNLMYLGAFYAVTGRRATPALDQTLWTYLWNASEPLHLPDDRFGLPKDHAEAIAQYDRLTAERCERTSALTRVIDYSRRPDAPPVLPRPVKPLWNLIAAPVAGRVLTTLGFGIMRPAMRSLTGTTWGKREQLDFAVLTTLLQLCNRCLPRRAVLTPLGHNRWHYEQLIGRYRHVALTSYAAPSPTEP